jgi:WD40 repeat protein
VQVWDWALRQRVREWPANADQGQASVSRFSADGQTLVLSTFHPPTRAHHYREWSIATGQETRAIALPPAKPGSRRGLVHAPGANELLLVSEGDTESMRYDFAAARFIPTTLLRLKQMNGPPSFSVDGRYLFAASMVGEVRVFDATTLQETAKLRGFMFGAHSVAFTPDGQRLVTGSTAQESITIWDHGNFERLLTFPTTDSLFYSTGFSPDGNVLVGLSGTGNIFFWRAPSFEEIAQAEARSAKLEGVVP